MKVLSFDPREGCVTALVEAIEDFYYLSLLIGKGDLVYAWTSRQLKVERRRGEHERGERVRVYIGVAVEAVEFHRFTRRLRIRGIIVEAPDFIEARGSYHTLAVDVGSEVKICKEKFTSFHRKLLRKASTRMKRALMVSVGDDEASFCVLRPQGVDFLYNSRLKVKKKLGGYSIEDAYREALVEVLGSLDKLARRTEADMVIIASTSLLMGFIRKLASRYPSLQRARYVTVSEGGIAGVYEVLRRRDLRDLFKEVRAAYEEEVVDRILALVLKNDRRVAIGMEEVEKAAQYGAVKMLVLVDGLLFSRDASRKLEIIMENAEKHAGDIVVVPMDTEHGKKLSGIGGVAALLYFPLE